MQSKNPESERNAEIGHRVYKAVPQLGRLRVITEVPNDGVEAFWAAGDGGRRSVYEAFRTAGATAVVAHDPPRWASTREWMPLGSTGFLYHGLGPEPGPR